MSWLSYPGANSYAVAKAAEWSLTNGIRLELAAQGTQVTGLAMSATDTDMMAGWDIPKNDPADVVRQALDGLEAGHLEIIADRDTALAKAALGADPALVYAGLPACWAEGLLATTGWPGWPPPARAGAACASGRRRTR
jgi:NAD(P)-dependent dehydrogenase (short-subunit alcohol dehydrogenase family)